MKITIITETPAQADAIIEVIEDAELEGKLEFSFTVVRDVDDRGNEP